MGNNSSQFPGASFGFNNRAREIDYGWRATHVTTVVAKGMIKTYYSDSPEYSYWEGCSTGGRQAAVEAQRFPNDFDGIVAGDLFNNAIEIAMEQIWSSVVFFKDVNGDGVGFDNNITQDDINALRDAVLAKCDVLGSDRIKDNVVDNPLACQKVFTESDIDAFGAGRRPQGGTDPGHQGRVPRTAQLPRPPLVQGQAAGVRIQLGQPRGADAGEQEFPRAGRLFLRAGQLPVVRARPGRAHGAAQRSFAAAGAGRVPLDGFRLRP